MTKLFCSLILFPVVCCFANPDLAFADSCYKARAERANGDKADKKNAELMIAAYKRAQKDSTIIEKATEGLVKSVYFSFRFVPFDKDKRKQKLDSLKNLAEDAYNQFPHNKEIAHIYASALSMWGADKNPLQAVKDGVAAKVRDVATAAEDYQVLGRAHFVLPYIPLVLSWPDKNLADKYLTQRTCTTTSSLQSFALTRNAMPTRSTLSNAVFPAVSGQTISWKTSAAAGS